MRFLLNFLSTLIVCSSLQASTLDGPLKAIDATHDEARASQERILTIQSDTQKAANEYKRLLQSADRQEEFSTELSERLEQQQLEMNSLKEQLAGREITQQRIMPLMRSMADNLEKFVALDLPFHQEERLGRAIKIKQMLASSSFSLQEQYRAVLAAYQQELEFGRSIEAWRDELKFTNERGENEKLTVEFLRIGRLAVYFQTMDSKRSGMWNQQQQKWQELPRSFNQELKQALRIAQNQQAPQILNLPLQAPMPATLNPQAAIKMEAAQ